MDLSRLTVKFKKGDSLLKIVKKRGHRTTDSTWRHKNNKTLVAKRKTEIALSAGDRIYVPLTDAERKQAIAEYEYWHQEWSDEGLAYAKLAELQMNLRIFAANLKSCRDQVNFGMAHAEDAVFRMLKIIRSEQPAAAKVKRYAQKVSGEVADAMRKVNDLTGQAKEGAAAVLGKVDPEFKKLLTGKSTPSAEAGKAVRTIKEVADKVAGAVGSVAKEITSAVTLSYWVDQLYFSDYEKLDLDKAVTEQERKMMKAINRLRKAKAVTIKNLNLVIGITEARLKGLDKSVPAAKKRYEAAGKKVKALPDLKVILAA